MSSAAAQLARAKRAAVIAGIDTRALKSLGDRGEVPMVRTADGVRLFDVFRVKEQVATAYRRRAVQLAAQIAEGQRRGVAAKNPKK